jgi:hypothetical protein
VIIPTKIKAIAEDPSHPFADCYDANDIATQVALSVSRVFATTNQPTTTPKKVDIKMPSINSANPDYNPTTPTKRYVAGIGANDNAQALVGALHRLGLMSNDMETPLKTLAAKGQPLSPYFQVSVYDVDRALRDVANVSTQDAIGFKGSLHRAGLMK